MLMNFEALQFEEPGTEKSLCVIKHWEQTRHSVVAGFFLKHFDLW